MPDRGALLRTEGEARFHNVISTQKSRKIEVISPTVPAVLRRIFPLPEIVKRLSGKPVPTIG